MDDPVNISYNGCFFEKDAMMHTKTCLVYQALFTI